MNNDSLHKLDHSALSGAAIDGGGEAGVVLFCHIAGPPHYCRGPTNWVGGFIANLVFVAEVKNGGERSSLMTMFSVPGGTLRAGGQVATCAAKP